MTMWRHCYGTCIDYGCDNGLTTSSQSSFSAVCMAWRHLTSPRDFIAWQKLTRDLPATNSISVDERACGPTRVARPLAMAPTEFYFWWRLPRVDRSEVPTLGRAIAEIVFQRVRFGANLRHEATADRRRNSCCNSFHNAADSDLRSRRDSYGYSMFIKFDQLSPQPVVAKTAAPTIDSESWVDFCAARRRYTQYSEAADTRRCGIPPHFTKFRSADRNK